MSAIAGFWSFAGEPARDYCGRMLQTLQLYGSNPKISADRSFACGRLLHAVLPEDKFDRQPLARGPYRMVADVRLDNRSELAAALGFSASRLALLSDADVLFECLLEWNAEGINRLIGEFAFGLWNESEQSLLLGRDLFGLRPLYFHEGSDFFAFASMPSGLHALPSVPREFDPEGMADELALLPPSGSQTLFRGIHRVQPGHLVTVTRGRVIPSNFWVPPRPSPAAKGADYEEGLRAVVDLAVESQLRGAGQAVGSHLSAGLDSSIVTATAARLMNPAKVVALTAAPRAGFKGTVPPENIADESTLAALTAAQFSNVEHVIVKGTEETLVDVLDRQLAYMQHPINGLCNSLWSRQLSRTAADRGLKVLLVGFSGNITVTYSGRQAWAQLLRQGRLTKLVKTGATMMANGVPARSLVAQLIGPLLPGQLWTLACRAYGRPVDLRGYTAISPAWQRRAEAKSKRLGFDLLYKPSSDSSAHRMLGLFDGDNGNYFKAVLGEFGLSLRDPLADKRVVEYCLSIPPVEFLRGNTERGLARLAFADRLPHAVATSHQRGYQGVDWHEAIARDMPLLREELEIVKRYDRASEVLDTDWIEKSFDSWPKDGLLRRNVIMRYRYGLLRGISAGHFMRKLAGTN